MGSYCFLSIFCYVRTFFSVKHYSTTFLFFLNLKSHLFLRFPITWSFEQLAVFGCGLGLHLSEDCTVTQKVSSRGPLQQSSIPPALMIFLRLAYPALLPCQLTLMLPHLHGWLGPFFQPEPWLGLDMHSNLSSLQQWLLETPRPAFSKQRRMLYLIFLSGRITLTASFSQRPSESQLRERTLIRLCWKVF